MDVTNRGLAERVGIATTERSGEHIHVRVAVGVVAAFAVKEEDSK